MGFQPPQAGLFDKGHQEHHKMLHCQNTGQILGCCVWRKCGLNHIGKKLLATADESKAQIFGITEIAAQSTPHGVGKRYHVYRRDKIKDTAWSEIALVLKISWVNVHAVNVQLCAVTMRLTGRRTLTVFAVASSKFTENIQCKFHPYFSGIQPLQDKTEYEVLHVRWDWGRFPALVT